MTVFGHVVSLGHHAFHNSQGKLTQVETVSRRTRIQNSNATHSSSVGMVSLPWYTLSSGTHLERKIKDVNALPMRTAHSSLCIVHIRSQEHVTFQSDSRLYVKLQYLRNGLQPHNTCTKMHYSNKNKLSGLWFI